MDTYFDDQIFDGVDYTVKSIVKGEYDNCTFENCNFSNVHASNLGFVECTFINCNFSNTIVDNSAFKDVTFVECKIIGVKFQDCDPFLLAIKFEKCQLNFSSFYKLSIQKTQFIDCIMKEVDFVEANLSGALFSNCDLKKAVFNRTNLENADFTSAFNFSINPAENKLKKAKFSQDNIKGLLDSFQIVVN